MDTMSSDEAHDVLGIAPGIPYTAARRAYRTRARATHPDTSAAADRQAADAMARLNVAWAVVRAEYAGDDLEGDAEPPAPEHTPNPRRWRRPLSAVAAAAVIVTGLGLTTVLSSGGGGDPSDYLGACLTDSGDVVSCSAGEASVRVTEQVSSAQECDGPAFATSSRDVFFCTEPLTS